MPTPPSSASSASSAPLPTPTIQPGAITPGERAIYAGYDAQRRLRLARFIAPSFAVALIILWLAISAYLFVARPTTTLLYIGYAVGWLSLLPFALAWWAVRRRRATLATSCVTIGTVTPILTVIVLWTWGQGLDAFMLCSFVTFGIIIVMVGLLGEPWQIVATTLFFNLFTLALLAFAPRAPEMRAIIGRELILFGPEQLIDQWVFALLLLVGGRAYRQSLRELGDVRVAYERARRLDELKDQFISSVNHELRTPIMTMMGYLEFLRDEATQLPAQRLNAIVERADQAARDLRQIVQSILDTRRADQGARDFTPRAVAVRPVVEAAARLIGPEIDPGLRRRHVAFAERELRVQVAPDIQIWGDAERLRQVLVNLLTNAVKYSPPGAPVELTARVVEVEPGQRGRAERMSADGFPSLPLLDSASDGWRAAQGTRGSTQGGGAPRRMVEIVVRDFGLGIPPDDAPLLFQRFARLPRDLASNVTGNGLGLFLCREFVTAMSGEIWVESSGVEGEGSTFLLRLPVPQQPLPAETSAARG